MPTASIDEIKLSEKKPTLLAGAARKAVHQLLSRIRVGRFVIEEDGEVYAFGQSQDEATIIANVSVHNMQAYRDTLVGGTIGAGESYMAGRWSSPDLLKVVRLWVLNLEMMDQVDGTRSWWHRVSMHCFHWFNRNTKTGSRRNIGAHYDLGNDFFDLFLDRNKMYSSAIFPAADADLDTAAAHKLQVVCEKLQLKPTDHLLEIGTGWGGLAIYAAKHFGCRVTTTTISEQQYRYAKTWVEREGLQDKIELLLRDYRDLDGRYDKIVSIEMIEAVGHQFYRSYFEQCSRLLKSGGLMLIQAITIPDQRYEAAKNSVDFIQKYIFPGGCLPSNEVIARHVSRDTDMQIVGLEDITAHYARTLAEWRRRFFAQLDRVKAQGFDAPFIRMWEYYLCYCEGGFAERVISTAQVVFAKPKARLS